MMKDQRPTQTEEAQPTRRNVLPAGLRSRFTSSRSAAAMRPARTIRVPEIIALTAAGLLLLVAASAYFFLLVPERSRLAALENERAQLQAKLRASTEGVERNESTQASVGKIVNSLNEFETSVLVAREPQTTTAVIE